jgi:hypothetical protein
MQIFDDSTDFTLISGIILVKLLGFCGCSANLALKYNIPIMPATGQIFSAFDFLLKRFE